MTTTRTTQELAEQYAKQLLSDWDADQLPRDIIELESWVREDIEADDHYFEIMADTQPMRRSEIDEVAEAAAEIVLAALQGGAQ